MWARTKAMPPARRFVSTARELTDGTVLLFKLSGWLKALIQGVDSGKLVKLEPGVHKAQNRVMSLSPLPGPAHFLKKKKKKTE